MNAAIDAFSRERVRWLVGKGDILIQKGELELDRFNELTEKTIRDEIHRSMIYQNLDDLPETVSSLAEMTDLDRSIVLYNLLAMLKWNQIEIVGEDHHSYLFTKKEL